MADDYDSDASDGGSVSGASDVMDTSFSRKRGASTARRRYGHLGHNALYQVSDVVVVAVAAASLVYIVVSLQRLHRSPSLNTHAHSACLVARCTRAAALLTPCLRLQFARNNDVEGVNRMLSDSDVLRRVDELSEDGMSALHYAARFNHFHVVQLLVEYGKAGAS